MKKLLIASAITLISFAANAEDQSTAIASMSARLTQLEETNRQLTGKVEELEHRLNQVSDIAVKAQEQAVNTPAEITGTTAVDGSAVSRPNEYVTKIAPTPEVAAASSAAEREFDAAFLNIAKEDYPAAKSQFKSFTEKYPGTSLAGESYFWIGEIAWTERDFNTAAINYLKGYKESPTGEKAAENILKLALTLKELGKKDEACKNIARFQQEFPAAHANLQDKAINAKIDLGCK